MLDHEALFVGLLVDEVVGLQHFAIDSLQPALPVTDAAGPFVQGRFERDHDYWAIFSPFALAQAPGFLDVAL